MARYSTPRCEYSVYTNQVVVGGRQQHEIRCTARAVAADGKRTKYCKNHQNALSRKGS